MIQDEGRKIHKPFEISKFFLVHIDNTVDGSEIWGDPAVEVGEWKSHSLRHIL